MERKNDEAHSTYQNLGRTVVSAGSFPPFTSLLVFFPNQKKFCFIITAVTFTIWKLPVMDSAIQFLNHFGLPIRRTVDYSDLLTLIILPFAYYYQNTNYHFLNLNHYFIGLFSIFTFTATTMPPHKEKKYVNINKTYNFEFSEAMLIDKLNRLTVNLARLL